MDKQQRRPHPMLDQLMRALERGPQGYQLSTGPLQALEKQGLGLADGGELYALLRELVDFAVFLNEKKESPQAAQGILQVAARLADHLTSLARRDVEQSSQSDQALRKRIEKERKALASPSGPQNALGPQAGVGVGIRQRR